MTWRCKLAQLKHKWRTAFALAMVYLRYAGARLHEIYFKDTMRPVKVISIVASWLCSLGLMSMAVPGHINEASMALAEAAAPLWFWGLLIWGVCLERIFNLLTPFNNKYAELVTPFAAVWVWFVLFLSALLDTSDSGHMFVLYLVPTLIEFWVLGRVFFDEFFDVYESYLYGNKEDTRG